MIYKLTEEQSTEYYNNICSVLDYAKELGDQASEIMMNWYSAYNMNNKSWFRKNWSSNKFYSKIANHEGLELRMSTENLYTYVQPRYLSGWVSKIKINTLHKLTGIDINKLKDEADIVLKAMKFTYKHGKLYQLINTKSELEQYCKVPYTLNENDLQQLKWVSELIRIYKLGDLE